MNTPRVVSGPQTFTIDARSDNAVDFDLFGGLPLPVAADEARRINTRAILKRRAFRSWKHAAIDEITADIGSGKYMAILSVRPPAASPATTHAAASSHLTWYLPGPDRRYNYGFARLPLPSGAEYREAVVAAWRQYEALEAAAPVGLKVEKSIFVGKYGFKLAAGEAYWRGVTPFPHVSHAYKIRIESRDDVHAFQAVLSEAIGREGQLIDLLT